MAVNINAEVPEIVSDRTLVTGLANLRIVGLNPTKEQLEKLGYKPKDEPIYFGTSKAGNANMRVDVHLEGEVNIGGTQDTDEPVKVSTKAAFFVENSTDRGLYIDKFGKFGKDTSKLDASARPAYNGELELIGFLKALCNTRPGEECSLDNIADLAGLGDVKELQTIMRNVVKARGVDQPHVQALLGIRDGKYQDVFTRQFDYVGRGGSNYLHSQVFKQAEYDRTNNRTATYYGPINTLTDQYVPSQYVLRKWTAEAQEAFENSQPKGTFGQAPGSGPAGMQQQPAGFGAPAAMPQNAFQQPGRQIGGVPVQQPQQFHQQPQVLQPMPIGGDDDMEGLPF